MRLLLSGEGPRDMGSCVMPVSCICSGDDFLAGPMAWIVDQIAAARLDYSSMELGLVDFVSKRTVYERANTLRRPQLPGKKQQRETAYFFKNARALAVLARELSEQDGDTVVAVLFRDSDGTQSSGRGLWQNKWDSMIRGFSVEDYHYGVPMVPKPKSEAWLLCALKPQQPYQHCERLERESGNDASSRNLKDQLDVVLGETANRDLLAEKVKSSEVDVFRITDMPSFQAFKDRLESVLDDVSKGVSCVA